MAEESRHLIWDGLIVLAFIAYAVSVGFFHRRRASQGLEEYFLAGRSLPGWKAGLSMAATQYAADTPLLVAGLVATAGIFSLWRLWVYAIAFLFMGFVLGPAWRRAGVLTDAELTELRYGGKAAALLRALKALHIGTLVNCTVLAMVLIAATRIAEPFLTWHLWLPAGFIEAIARFMERSGFALTLLPPEHPQVWLYAANNFLSILFIVAFTWLYSTTGGLRSVVETDVAQFSILLLATAAYAGFVVMRVGGLATIPAKLSELYGTQAADRILSFGPVAWDGAAVLFVAVLAVQWFAQVNADGTGYLAQRTMACRSDRDAKTAAMTFAFLQVVVRSLLWLPIVLGLLILYPAEGLPAWGNAPEALRIEREASFAWGMRDLLPVGVRGLLFTGMLAALASTVDTHLNWGASYWTNDLYKRFLMGSWIRRNPSRRELIWVARLSNVGILGVALLIGMNLRSIQATWHLTLLFGSGLGVVLILRWLWYRVNVYSELAAGGVSLLLSPILLFGFPRLSEAERLLWMVALSTGAVLAVTALTQPESADTLRTFYARARPLGFWGPVASDCGESPRAWRRSFWRAVCATGLASGSLFLMLVGAGGWLTRATPAAASHSFLLLAAGLALIPVWWRLGFRSFASELN